MARPCKESIASTNRGQEFLQLLAANKSLNWKTWEHHQLTLGHYSRVRSCQTTSQARRPSEISEPASDLNTRALRSRVRSCQTLRRQGALRKSPKLPLPISTLERSENANLHGVLCQKASSREVNIGSGAVLDLRSSALEAKDPGSVRSWSSLGPPALTRYCWPISLFLGGLLLALLAPAAHSWFLAGAI